MRFIGGAPYHPPAPLPGDVACRDALRAPLCSPADFTPGRFATRGAPQRSKRYITSVRSTYLTPPRTAARESASLPPTCGPRWCECDHWFQRRTCENGAL